MSLFIDGKSAEDLTALDHKPVALLTDQELVLQLRRAREKNKAKPGADSRDRESRCVEEIRRRERASKGTNHES